MAPTAASRPGGKFANLSAQSHGKVLNNNDNGEKDGTVDAPFSTGAVKRNAKNLTKLSSSQSAIESSRKNSNSSSVNDEHETRLREIEKLLLEKKDKLSTHPVFSDLDKAEDLVLDLLSLSSSSANTLSLLTTAQDQGENQAGTSNSVEKLSNQIQDNSKSYISKLNNIYSLLEPHAHLVVSYGNMKQEINKKEIIDKHLGPKNEINSTDTKDASKNQGSNSSISAKKNMYTARLETRLAMERKALLKEMVRLEKLDHEQDKSNNNMINDASATAVETTESPDEIVRISTTSENTKIASTEKGTEMLTNKRKRDD